MSICEQAPDLRANSAEISTFRPGIAASQRCVRVAAGVTLRWHLDCSLAPDGIVGSPPRAHSRVENVTNPPPPVWFGLLQLDRNQEVTVAIGDLGRHITNVARINAPSIRHRCHLMTDACSSPTRRTTHPGLNGIVYHPTQYTVTRAVASPVSGIWRDERGLGKSLPRPLIKC